MEIEARIVTTTRDFAHAIGVQWGLNGRANGTIGNTTDLAFPNSGSLGGRVAAQGAAQSGDIRANPVNDAGTAVNLAAAARIERDRPGARRGERRLQPRRRADGTRAQGKGRILSTPRVTTQNNVEAEVTQGMQIPMQTVANNTVTVTFKDAVLTLKVTPQITAANTVIMQITLENAHAGFARCNGIPSIDTQRAITRVQVDDGDDHGHRRHLRQPRDHGRGPDARPAPHSVARLVVQAGQPDRQSRELLIFITPRILKG